MPPTGTTDISPSGIGEAVEVALKLLAHLLHGPAGDGAIPTGSCGQSHLGLLGRVLMSRHGGLQCRVHRCPWGDAITRWMVCRSELNGTMTDLTSP